MKRKLVIELKFGGLGDHLFFSHIPRIAKTIYNYEYVYISNKSEIRSIATKQLIWDLNPYVDGFTDDDCTFFDNDIFNLIIPNTNILDKVMLSYGFDDNERFHEPEIYYKPQIISDCKDLVVFDPNYISNIGLVSNKKLNKFLNGFSDVHVMKKMNKVVKFSVNNKEIVAVDIFNYCDIIFSSKQFICMTSGGATLSAALKKKSIVIYGFGQTELHRHSRLHNYVNLSSRNANFLYFFYKILYPLKSYIKKFKKIP